MSTLQGRIEAVIAKREANKGAAFRIKKGAPVDGSIAIVCMDDLRAVLKILREREYDPEDATWFEDGS